MKRGVPSLRYEMLFKILPWISGYRFSWWPWREEWDWSNVEWASDCRWYLQNVARTEQTRSSENASNLDAAIASSEYRASKCHLPRFCSQLHESVSNWPMISWWLPWTSKYRDKQIEGRESASTHLDEERFWRMASSELLRRVALVRTDVSEELSAFITRVTRIGELGMLAVTSNKAC
jgi:hypothetical protein